jgi:SAGA-associated factor 29
MDRKSRTSRSATQDNSSEEFQLWKQICNSLMELEHIQKKAESVVKSLNDMRSTSRSDEGIVTHKYFTSGSGHSPHSLSSFLGGI